MRGVGLCVLAFLAGAGSLLFALPSPVRLDDPKAKPAFAGYGVMQRSQARRNDDGSDPTPQQIERARRQANQIRRNSIEPMSAGVGAATWTWVGPGNVGGRIRTIIIHPSDANTIWIASASGGIWKTTNGGSNWFALDDFLPSLSIGCMAIDPTNPQKLYAGTGEGFFETEDGSSNTAAVKGAGIYVTTDGGSTWNSLPSTQNANFEHVTRLAIHPTNANLILAATSTGLWRSTNGGSTWSIRYSEHVYDVDFSPNGSSAILGMHEHGVAYSTDAGLNWTDSPSIVTNAHRTEVAYAPSNPSVVYATVSRDDETIRVWRSANGGQTFTQQAAATIQTYQAYNNALWVNPTNANDILYGGVYLYRSTNGGGSRSQVFNNVHPDIHGFTTHPQFNGTTNRIVFVATDGGIIRLNDHQGAASNFTILNNNLGITQFYGAAISPLNGNIVGGTQDNFTQRYTGNAQNWVSVFGGDGGYASVDPADSNFWYGCVYWALQFRTTNNWGSSGYIYNTANPITDANNAANVNFINHHILDPNLSTRMYVGAKRLWRSNDVKAASPSWFVVKPAIVIPRGPGGGSQITPPPAHMEPNPPENISTLAVARGNSDVVWVGHNNGWVYKTTDGTAANPTWTRVDSNGPLPGRWVGRIYISPFDANTVYVAYMGWQPNNLWKTTDGGANWTQVVGLPAAPISCIQGHPVNPNWLYAGTELGLFTSSNGGSTWTSDNQFPANVPIEELHWRNNTTLMAVTHGRGIFVATVNSPEDAFGPTSLALVTGLNPTGGLNDIRTVDGRTYGASPDYTLSRGTPPMSYEFRGTSPIGVPATMKVRVNALMTGLAGCPAVVQMYRPTTNEWVNVATLNVTDTATWFTVVISSAPQFVAGDGSVRTRIGFDPGATAPRVWSGRVDAVYWNVSP